MTTISKNKQQLIKRLHVQLNKAGMMHQKPEILESFGVSSSKDLAEEELTHIINQLTGEGDKWRKRVIAAVFSWCKRINYACDLKRVKSIACRATGYKKFNDIPVSRLRDVYNEFVRKSTVTVGVADFKEEMKNYLESRN